MKNIKEISIKWITNVVGYFIILNIKELIHPTLHTENKITWICLEAIVFGIMMVAIDQFMSQRKNKKSNKTNKKDE